MDSEVVTSPQKKKKQVLLTSYFTTPGRNKPRGPVAPLFETPHGGKRKSDSTDVGDEPVKRRSSSARVTASEAPGQRAIDAGQNVIGCVSCAKCGMSYSVDIQSDVAAHSTVHNYRTSIDDLIVPEKSLSKWIGDKKCHLEDVIVLRSAASITTPPSLLRRTEKLFANRVKVEIGFAEETRKHEGRESSSLWRRSGAAGQRRGRTAWVAVIRDEGGRPWIGGTVLVEEVDRAFQVDSDQERRGMFMGINRLWTHPRARRKGLATRLIDHARANFLKYRCLGRHEVAFSEPTEEGMRFALKFIDSKNEELKEKQPLLVYNLLGH